MTPAEAHIVAAKIATNWACEWSPATQVSWVDALEELDFGTAGTAFARIRDDEDAPSIARFRATCKTLCTPSNDPISACDDCAGVGWVEGRDLVIADGADGHRYTQVRPCDCPRGGLAREQSKTLERVNGPLRLEPV